MVRAAEHGRSAEADHREILRMALAGGRAAARRPRTAWPYSGNGPPDAAGYRRATCWRELGTNGCGPWLARTSDVAFVVDASVGLKWVLQQPDSPQAERLARSDVDLLVPAPVAAG